VSSPGRDPNLLIFAHLPWCSAAATVLFDSLEGQVRRRTVDNVAAVREAVDEGWPDVVALIWPTAAERHLNRLRDLLDRVPEARVLAVSAEPDSVIARRARGAGAKGHVSFESTAQDLSTAIRALMDGSTYFAEADEVAADEQPEPRAVPADLERRLDKLTRRERQVMELLGQGYANREIANALGLREGTIRIYVHRVIRQLGLRNRVDVALCASRLARHG